MSEYKLAEEIIKRSLASHWDAAKIEWYLKEIFYEDEPTNCLCGHFPVIESCVLLNTLNGNTAVVGNVCVKKFMGLGSDKLFQAIGRIKKDITKSVNAETISYAYDKKWIFENDKNFYLDILRKRNLSERQLKWKKDINSRIISGVANSGIR